MIYGIVFMVVLTLALATLIIDLAYPLLDPRITHPRAAGAATYPSNDWSI